MLSGSFAMPALAKTQVNPVRVEIDGLPVEFDVPPDTRNGRILVPFRAIAEALNVKVDWDGRTQTINASEKGTTVRLQVDQKTAQRNGAAISLDVPPMIHNGRTLVPLRFFSEAFGRNVEWDDAKQTANIRSAPSPLTVIGFYALGDSQTSSWSDLFGKAYPDRATGNTDVVDEVALGWYSLDKEGNLLTKSSTGWQRPEDWEEVLKAANSVQLQTEMVIHLTDGDGTISSLLDNKAAMNKAVSDIMREAGMYGGVNLDFEGLGWEMNDPQLQIERDKFIHFVQLLSKQLKARNLTLTLSLHPLNSAYLGYDYKALGKLSDRIIVMAYDYGASPEPTSYVLEAVQMAKAAVPAEKLVLGISAPSETPESILTKVQIAKRYHLDCVALWRLGVVPDKMWEKLRETVQTD